VLSQADVDKKRKSKEENRRKVKEQRKNRVKEAKLTGKPSTLDKEAVMKKQEEKRQEESNKEQLDKETLLQLEFAQKVVLIRSIEKEISTDVEKKYRKLQDLMLFTEDPRDVDIV